MNERTKCIVCHRAGITPFFRIEHLPVCCNRLCASRDAALREPKVAISLGACPDCGHVFNTEYESARLSYQPGYENSLRGSERFRKYDDALVLSLLERYELHGRTIIEIGCGRGEFLRALCERGSNRGIGFDPSYSNDEDNAADSPGIVILPEFYEAHDKDLNPDFICSRHTLEHIEDPRAFLSNIRKATPRVGIPVFFEVPNGFYTLRDGGIWDIIYEHRSYFTPKSLRRIFFETGFEPGEVADTFAGQFLTIYTKTDGRQPRTSCSVTPDSYYLARSFARRFESKLKEWTRRLAQWERERKKLLVWGAGSKAATFLNLLRPASIDYVVDVNPRKHGKYVIGSGQQIVPPEFLCEYPVDEIICMNPNYLEEIAALTKALGSHASLVSA